MTESSMEADVLIGLAVYAFIFGVVAALIFSADRRGVSSFRILPGSSAEWAAYWFHLIEFTLFCGAFAALQPAAEFYPLWAERTLVWVACGSAILLVISTIAFWRFDRPLCQNAILWLAFFSVCLFLMFPAAAISRNS